MTDRPDCYFCKKPIPETDKYACLWLAIPHGLLAAFVCEKCSERNELEDITAEVTGR